MPYTDSLDHESPSQKKRAERKQKTAKRQYAEKKAIKAQKTIDGSTSQIVDERTGKVVNTIKLSPVERKSFGRFDKNKGETTNSSDLPKLTNKETAEIQDRFRDTVRQIKKDGVPQPDTKELEETRREMFESARKEKGERGTFKGVAKSIFSDITSRLNKLKGPQDNTIKVPTGGGIRSGAKDSGVHGQSKNSRKKAPKPKQKRQPTKKQKKKDVEYFTGVGV